MYSIIWCCVLLSPFTASCMDETGEQVQQRVLQRQPSTPYFSMFTPKSSSFVSEPSISNLPSDNSFVLSDDGSPQLTGIRNPKTVSPNHSPKQPGDTNKKVFSKEEAIGYVKTGDIRSFNSLVLQSAIEKNDLVLQEVCTEIDACKKEVEQKQNAVIARSSTCSLAGILVGMYGIVNMALNIVNEKQVKEHCSNSYDTKALHTNTSIMNQYVDPLLLITAGGSLFAIGLRHVFNPQVGALRQHHQQLEKMKKTLGKIKTPEEV